MNAGKEGEKGMEDGGEREGKCWRNRQRRGMGMECRVRERKHDRKEGDRTEERRRRKLEKGAKGGDRG